MDKILHCETHGCHYSTRYGCPFCPAEPDVDVQSIRVTDAATIERIRAEAYARGAEDMRERAAGIDPVVVVAQVRRAVEAIENGRASTARDVLLTLASSMLLKDPATWSEQERAEVQRFGEECARRIREVKP